MKSPPPHALLLACTLLACGSDPAGQPDPGDQVTSYRLSGNVVDFQTNDRIEGQAAVATDGISPPPRVGVQGADFDVTEIPPGSVFHILVGAAPAYHSTYAGSFEVIDSDVDQASVRVVSETYLASLFDALGVPVAAGSVLIAQLTDEAGAPLAGVPASALELDDANGFVGPLFLDDQLRPDALLEATSASGYAVFFDVAPGLVTVHATTGSGYSMAMTPSPIATSAVTLATVEVRAGDEPALPTNVSFENDVLPIFEYRGCAACHSKKEIGNEVGGLSLDMKDKAKLYKEVAEEISPRYGVARVNLQEPADSLILTQPSPEDPPDAHPNITFRGPTDYDYQVVLAWIQEGAKMN